MRGSLGKPRDDPRGLLLYCRCAVCRADPKLWGPAAHCPLHKPCWSISPALHQLWKWEHPKGGWTSSNSRSQHSWVLAVSVQLDKAGWGSCSLCRIWQSWAQTSVLRMQNLPGCLLPWASHVSDAGEGGGKNVKQDFSSCPYVMPLLSFLLTFLSTDVALTAQCGHRYQPRTWLSCLFFLKREQQGQWGNGNCQGKERADLNFLHFSRARNS